MFKVDFCISSPSSPPLLCALLHPCSQSCLTKPTKQRMWQKHDPSLLRYHLHSSFFNIVTLTFSILHWHILNSFFYFSKPYLLESCNSIANSVETPIIININVWPLTFLSELEHSLYKCFLCKILKFKKLNCSLNILAIWYNIQVKARKNSLRFLKMLVHWHRHCTTGTTITAFCTFHLTAY